MKNKVIRFKSVLAKGYFTITIDESLNHLIGRVHAPKKLEEANEFLRNLKVPLPR